MLVKYKGTLNYKELGTSVLLFSNLNEHGGKNNRIEHMKYIYVEFLWLENTFKTTLRSSTLTMKHKNITRIALFRLALMHFFDEFKILLLLIKKCVPRSGAVLIFRADMLTR